MKDHHKSTTVTLNKPEYADEDLMTNYLKSIGFEIKNVEGDGNCFFYALIDQLGPEKLAELRENFKSEHSKFKEDYEFLRAIAQGDGYKDGEYANDEIIESFVEKTGLSIKVFSARSNGVTTQILSRDENGKVNCILPIRTSAPKDAQVNIFLTSEHFMSVNKIPKVAKLIPYNHNFLAAFLKEVTKSALEYVTKNISTVGENIAAKFLEKNQEAIIGNTTLEERQGLIARSLSYLFGKKETFELEAQKDFNHPDFGAYHEVNSSLTNVITLYKDDIKAMDEELAAKLLFEDCKEFAKIDPIAAAKAMLKYRDQLTKYIDSQTLGDTSETLECNLLLDQNSENTTLKIDFGEFAQKVIRERASKPASREI